MWFEAGGLLFLVHLTVGILLRPYSDMFLKRDLLNKAFKIDAREKDKLVGSQMSLINRGPGSKVGFKTSSAANSALGNGGDSGRSTGRSSKMPSARIVPSSQTMVPAQRGILQEKAGENLTARGMIIKNLQTIRTTLDVRTFLWYLLEKVQAVEKINTGIYQLLACRCCMRSWTRSGRVIRLVSKGKKRLNKFSEITTLMKAKINTDMLSQRLLTNEQQILFQVQRARALNLDSDDADNVDVNCSINSDIHENVTTQNTFERRLMGWTAVTDLDKKLLLGVIQNVPRLQRDLKDNLKQRPNDFNIFSKLDDPFKSDKAFFEPEKLKTKTEKDYLMHLAEKPVMIEL